MLRTGVDLIDIERVERAIERHGERFFKRFFTPAEQTYCEGRLASLAARIAAKEAVAKALGTGIGDVRWVEIEILADERKRPILVLHGNAAQLAASLGLDEWDISLTHTQQQAMAFVVALSRSN
ncbi:MAG: holo-[acyl-carrier-protein] synthase [Phototrophicales bacterium]|nr:MAG: holo-[acyl-carrier-protein] synthase [Phototrophicales bacterium]